MTQRDPGIHFAMEKLVTGIAYVGAVLLGLLGLWLLIDDAVEAGIFLLVISAITLVMCVTTTAIHRSKRP